MTRRGFVLATAATALAGAPGLARARRPRVVVVGAGIAGLSAATAARRDGWDVLVLEATDRVGGRIRTEHFAGGAVVEAGGEFIDGSHATMLGYARRFTLPLQDVWRTGPDLPGCVLSNGRLRPDRGRYAAAEDRWYAALDALGGRSLDARSAGDLLDRLELSPGAREHIAHALVRDDYTVEPEELSLRFLVRSERVEAFGEERYRIRGGNDQVCTALAEALGAAVALGTPATAVDRGGLGVSVTAGGETISADACILTAPLPALRGIAFSPGLPEPLARPVRELQYGTGVKVLLEYPDRPWLSHGCNGDLRTDGPASTTWEAAPGILTVYAVGAPGATMAALGEPERIAAAAADVARAFPGAEPVAGRSVTWAQTYAAPAPGQVNGLAAALRRPAGRLLLAGEHAARLTGYMEGAARSGLSAARALRGLT